MSTKPTTIIFPDLVLLSDFGGNFKAYFDEIFKIFENDFVISNPSFLKKRVIAKKYPEEETMHRTFYHLTHSGENEKNRQPDLNRMSRIRYPKFFIENHMHDAFLVWENIRGKDERILILNQKERYLTVLTRRKEYYNLTTAYLLDYDHSYKKCMREYEAYIKAKTA